MICYMCEEELPEVPGLDVCDGCQSDFEAQAEPATSTSEWVDNMMGGYTDDELAAAFALVENPEHWKLPIDATVRAEVKPHQIETAVVFYTGSVAEVTANADGSMHVNAAGYYAVCGA